MLVVRACVIPHRGALDELNSFKDDCGIVVNVKTQII